MEKFSLHCAKIVGTPTETAGSWVYTFFPQELEKLEKRGCLLAVVGLTEFVGSSEMAMVGKEIISRLQEEYYGDLETSAFLALQKTINKVAEEAKEGAEFKLDVGVVTVVGEILYAMVNNGGRLMVKRQGEIKTILSESTILSGYLQDGDTFLLGTGEFFRLVGEDVLFSALKALTPEEGVEILAPVIHGQLDGGAAAIIFQASQITEPITEEAEEKREEKILPTVELGQEEKEKNAFVKGRSLKNKLGDFVVATDEKIKKRLIFLKANKEKAPRSPKTLIIVALILLVVLAGGVFFGRNQRGNTTLNGETSSLLEQARAKKEEGEALLTLNPAKSRQLLLEAQGLTKKIEQSGTQSEGFLQFKQELDKVLNSLLQEHQVEGELFFDLEIVKVGASGSNFIFSGEQIIVLDKTQNSLYAVNLNDKKSSILAGGEKLAGANFITDLNGNLYVLADEGLYKVNKTPELKIKKDEEWGLPLGLASFGNNLYLLSGKEIWKYVLSEEGFSSKQRWLKQENNLEQALKMAIDGSIWLLTKDGQVLKFTQGLKENFTLTGLSKPLLGPKAFYTTADLKNLYLLDKGNSRVVIFNKLGEYQKEYLWPGLAQADDLLVTPQEDQAFVLAGSKIFKLNLQ